MRLADDVFVGYEIEAIPDGADEADVGEGIQGAELVEWDATMHVDDRGVVGGGVSAVDAADELLDLSLELDIFGDARAGGNGELDEDYFAEILRVVGEEFLEGEELLGDAFGIVQAVHAEDDRFALVSAGEGREFVLDFGGVERLAESGWIDANGEVVDDDLASVIVKVAWGAPDVGKDLLGGV